MAIKQKKIIYVIDDVVHSHPSIHHRRCSLVEIAQNIGIRTWDKIIRLIKYQHDIWACDQTWAKVHFGMGELIFIFAPSPAAMPKVAEWASYVLRGARVKAIREGTIGCHMREALTPYGCISCQKPRNSKVTPILFKKQKRFQVFKVIFKKFIFVTGAWHQLVTSSNPILNIF